MKRMGEKMMIADNVPPDYEMVYRFGAKMLVMGSPLKL